MLLLPGSSCLYLMRHGQTDYNRRQVRCGGDVDVPLDTTGEAQADEIGKLLASLDLHIGWIMAGTLQRTRSTAIRVADHLGPLPIEADARLNERALGAWNGLPIAATEPWLRERRTPPGGESEAAFRTRLQAWLEATVPRCATPGLIVASKGVGRVMSELLVGQPGVALDNGGVLCFCGTARGNLMRRIGPGAPG